MAKAKQFAVFGLGVFGRTVALALSELGFEVLGVDANEEVVQSLADELTYVVTADITDEDAFRELGIAHFDAAVVAMSDLGASLMCTLLCREAGLQSIVVKAKNDRHGFMAERLGATEVIYPNVDMARRVAHNLASNNVMDYIELSDDISLISARVPPMAVGMSLAESDLRRNYDVDVVAIRKRSGLVVNPPSETVLDSEDELVIIGGALEVKRFGNHLIESPD
ncbi:MAG: TrkA family potassium uptake protein [Schwartzia sp.]|nr:TrkA family potassium uptake protein [Schwartzia sp. (in: firmicutes)]